MHMYMLYHPPWNTGFMHCLPPHSFAQHFMFPEQKESLEHVTVARQAPVLRIGGQRPSETVQQNEN